jgi:ferredoxin-like protein FixX
MLSGEGFLWVLCKERFCIYACPAHLYSLNEKGEMVIEYAGCLECGTCQIACIYGSVKWKYPMVASVCTTALDDGNLIPL